MRRRIALCMAVLMLCATGGAAQSIGKRKSTPAKTEPVTDLRKVDFLNFTYRSSLCSQEFGRQGIGKTVRVIKGEYKNGSVYFAVDERTVVFGDLTGDGQDEAIVPVECGAVGANFSRTEINVFTIKNGRTTLVGQIGDKEFERDYRQAYPDAESYWGLTGSALKIADGRLVVEVVADGPHAAPKYSVTLEYRVQGTRITLAGSPKRAESAP